MKYVGSWSANNGSSYASGYESNNKKALAKELSEICKGNTFSGSSGSWSIYEKSDVDKMEPVLNGSIRR